MATEVSHAMSEKETDDLDEMREKLERAEFSVSCAKCTGQIVSSYEED